MSSQAAAHLRLGKNEHASIDAAIGRELKSLDHFFARVQVESDDADLEAHRAWKTNRPQSTPALHSTRQARDFFSRPVRYELNKFYYDVTSHPSRAQLKQLWEDMNLLQLVPYIDRKKIVKWFQNKRNYVKRLEERDAPMVRIRERIRFEAQRPSTPVSSDDDDDSHIASESESDAASDLSSSSSSSSSSSEEEEN